MNTRARDFDAEAWSTQGKSLMKHIALHISAGPGGAERVRLLNRALELAPRFGGAQTPAAQIEMWLQAFVAEAEYHFAPASAEQLHREDASG